MPGTQRPVSKYHWVNASIWKLLKKDVVWKDWCWSWNSNTLANWYEELTHWKRPWCWKRLMVGGEGGGSDVWMASPTQCTWIWVNSGSWWWTGKPGGLQSMGSQGVGHDWATELSWDKTEFVETEKNKPFNAVILKEDASATTQSREYRTFNIYMTP